MHGLLISQPHSCTSLFFQVHLQGVLSQQSFFLKSSWRNECLWWETLSCWQLCSRKRDPPALLENTHRDTTCTELSKVFQHRFLKVIPSKLPGCKKGGQEAHVCAKFPDNPSNSCWDISSNYCNEERDRRSLQRDFKINPPDHSVDVCVWEHLFTQACCSHSLGDQGLGGVPLVLSGTKDCFRSKCKYLHQSLGLISSHGEMFSVSAPLFESLQGWICDFKTLSAVFVPVVNSISLLKKCV